MHKKRDIPALLLLVCRGAVPAFYSKQQLQHVKLVRMFTTVILSLSVHASPRILLSLGFALYIDAYIIIDQVCIVIVRGCIVCTCIQCPQLHTSFHIHKMQSMQNKSLVVFVAENGHMANTDRYSMCKNALQAGRDTRSSVLVSHR